MAHMLLPLAKEHLLGSESKILNQGKEINGTVIVFINMDKSFFNLIFCICV